MKTTLALAVVLLAGCGGAQHPDTCRVTRTACDECASALSRHCDEDSIDIAGEPRAALCSATAAACAICETMEAEYCE